MFLTHIRPKQLVHGYTYDVFTSREKEESWVQYQNPEDWAMLLEPTGLSFDLLKTCVISLRGGKRRKLPITTSCQSHPQLFIEDLGERETVFYTWSRKPWRSRKFIIMSSLGEESLQDNSFLFCKVFPIPLLSNMSKK